MDRRRFLQSAASAAAIGATAATIGATAASCGQGSDSLLQDCFGPQSPAYSIIPVIGDGKYVWTKPPANQSGYLEPRQYDLSIQIELQGRGNASQVRATTVAPVQHKEQKIESVNVQTSGCSANLRLLSPDAGQLFLFAPRLVKQQKIKAVAHFRLTLYKSYQGYKKDQFPASQNVDKAMAKQFLYDSPGIQTRFKEVRELAAELTLQLDHPWDKARVYYQWVWQNIRPLAGSYTSVVEALRDRVGDCEERAAVFVALCRASGIASRLVWVPNHNWAEFYLKDHQGNGQWIPAHTSAYSWFGWTGVHELVLQKGDRVELPEKSKPQRLLADWMQWQGARPIARYYAQLTPLPDTGSGEAGPGARRKDKKGEWLPVGTHPLDRRLRDGGRLLAR